MYGLRYDAFPTKATGGSGSGEFGARGGHHECYRGILRRSIGDVVQAGVFETVRRRRTGGCMSGAKARKLDLSICSASSSLSLFSLSLSESKYNLVRFADGGTLCRCKGATAHRAVLILPVEELTKYIHVTESGPSSDIRVSELFCSSCPSIPAFLRVCR